MSQEIQQIDVRSKTIELVPLSDIKLNPDNRNKHSPEQIKWIADLIKGNKYRQPGVVSNQTGFLAAGEGRYLALKLLGATHMPVMRQDFDTWEEEYAFGVSDNAVASQAVLDFAAINKDLERLGPDFDLKMLGIKDFAIEPADKYGDKDADATPDVRKTDIQMGDLFQLGAHRLACGDSTRAVDIERLMNGEKADMVFTDPPYGVSYGSKNQFLNNLDEGNRIQKDIENDQGMTDDELREFISKAMECCLDACSNKAAYYLTAPPGDKLYPILGGILDGGWQVKAGLVWVKSNHVLGRSDYNYKHEMVLYGWKKKGTHEYFGGFATSVWEFPKPQVNDLHPTMKPVELIEYAIKNSTKQGGSVLDPFLGSGSTLIACEKTNRKCYGSEIDASYCDVIIRRWEKFSGQTAYLIEDINGKLPNGPVPFAELSSMRSATHTEESKNTAQKNAGH